MFHEEAKHTEKHLGKTKQLAAWLEEKRVGVCRNFGTKGMTFHFREHELLCCM